MGAYKHSINWKGRRGTAVMEGGISGPHAGGLVVSSVLFE